VRTLFSGVSRGTETLVWGGRVPRSQYSIMRAPHQEGEFGGPVKYGYLTVGVVEDGPPDLAGRTVFALYPHQTRFTVPAADVHPVPWGVPAGRAILAGTVETAINALWDVPPRLGDRIAVLGGGMVGCAVAMLAARIPGTRVELIDIDARRAATASLLGVAFALPGSATRNADVVVHASGSAAGLATALELAGFEALLLELSWYGDRHPAVPLGEAFHSRRLTLKSSQVGAIATAQRSRWSPQRRFDLVLRLLGDARLDALISGESAFEDLPETLARLAAPSEYTLCHRITYS
jgi:threonine dehydrogenase-like Zn-dependent dehydrogenase